MGPKSQVINHACAGQDELYIAIHQLVYQWSLDNSTIHKRFHNSLTPEVLNSVFTRLLPIIPTSSEWFGNLPIGPRLEEEIVEFLTHFSSTWALDMETVKARNYPLTAFDLTMDHLYLSPSLQYVLFLECIKTLELKNDRLIINLRDVFSKEQTEAFEIMEEGDRIGDQFLAEYQRLLGLNQAIISSKSTLSSRPVELVPDLFESAHTPSNPPEYYDTLHSYIESFGTDRSKFQSLLNASADPKDIYPMFHQLTCIWSIDRSKVHKMFQATLSPEAVDSAFDILRIYLNLPFGHIGWFQGFPIPLNRLQNIFDTKPGVLDSIANDLEGLGQLGDKLNMVKPGVCPLSAFILTTVTGCARSPTLQVQLFNESLRRLHITDEQLVIDLRNVFNNEHPEIAKIFEQEISTRQRFKVEYESLIQAHQTQ